MADTGDATVDVNACRSPSALRRIVGDMPFYALANGSQAAAGFLSLVLFTRWLPPGEYGLYALTLTATSVVELTVFSWVNNATLRYLPQERVGRDSVFLATNFMTTCALLLVASTLWVYVAIAFLGGSDAWTAALRVGALVLVARVLFSFAVGIVRARRQTHRYALYTAASAFGSVGLAAALRITFGTGATGILYMVAVATAIPTAVELVRSGALGWLRPNLFVSRVARRSAAYGLPLAGATFGAVVLSVADRFMLQYYRGVGAVGSYSAGYDLADKSLKLMFTVLLASSLPVVMGVLAKDGIGEANKVINRTIRIYLVWMVPITVTLVVFRREMVETVLGPSFGAATTVVPWVALGTLCWGATQILAQSFQVQEQTLSLLYWLLAAAALNVGLNLWAIPAAGILGAAVTTTASYAAYLIVLWLRRIRHPQLSFTGVEALLVVAAGVVMYAAMSIGSTLAAPPPVPIAVTLAIGAITYGVSLRLLSPVSFQEAAGHLEKVSSLARSGLYRGD